MLKKCTLNLFSILVLIGCKNTDNNHNTDFTLKPEKILLVDSEYALVSNAKDVFKNLKIVPLRFKDSTMFSGIDKILVNNNSYFIFDQKFTSVYKFDSSGIFQNRIGKLGVAINEYRSLEDFLIDSLNQVVLLSNSNQSLFYYTPDNNFIKSQHIGFYNSGFVIAGLNKFLYYLSYNDSKKSGPYNFLLTDSTGNIIERYLSFNKKISNMSISFSGFINSDGKELLCSDAFNDTIYSVSNENKLSHKYYIDFGKYSLQKIRQDHKKLIDSHMLFKENTAYLGNEVTFNDNYLIFSYTYKNQMNYCIYNRATKKILRINKGIEDGLFRLLNYPLLISKDSKCYFAVSPESAIRFKEKNQKLFEGLQKDWPALYTFLEKITPNNNYFLVTVDLK